MTRIAAATALVLTALLIPASASGVWGGALDTAHPQVGAMYFDYEGTGEPRIDGQICSGSYAGESKDGRNDVFVTAGHCMPPPELGIPASDIYVSFDSNASSSDPHDLVSSPIQVQSYHLMPGFGHHAGDPRDIGILLLPKDSVPASLTPVQLAPAGFLDILKTQGALNFRVMDIVGYCVTRSGTGQGRRTSHSRGSADLGRRSSLVSARRCCASARTTASARALGSASVTPVRRRSTRPRTASSRSREAATGNAMPRATTTGSTQLRRGASSGSS